MKKIIITIIIFLAMICNSIITTLYTAAKFTEFSNNLKLISCTINQNNWPFAQKEINNLTNEFENHEKKLQLFLNRENLEKIKQNLNKLKIAINFKQKPKSTAQILKLQNTFQKTISDEMPLIQNIL